MKFEWIVLFIIHHSLAQRIDEAAVVYPDNCNGYINGTSLTCNNTESKLLVALSYLFSYS